MCGIYGYLLAGRPESAPDLEQATRALRHRGPDDAGTYQAFGDDFALGFAHTRLRILDLSAAGHQPMASRGGRYVMVYNGEIYNFADVRRELEGLGERFASSGDTEVLLAAYVRWGRECLRRLRGMFAIAIWDTETRRLFLARDRLGVKPLYYVELPGGGLAFASEVRVLMDSGLCPRTLSIDGLHSYLLYGSVREPFSIVEGVRALPGGCTLETQAGSSPRIERYWSLPLHQEDAGTVEEITPRLRSVLTESVRLRLVADVPVGVFLSSGVDSAAITALAAQSSDRPIHTFTVTFDAADDEGALAAKFAERFGCIHHSAHLETRAIANDIVPALSALDQPSADGTNTYFVSKAAREAGLAVALSGVGGDELFAGYATFRRFSRLKPLWGLRLPSLMRGAAARVTSAPRVPRELRKAVALLGAGGSADASYEVFRAMFVPGQRDALLVPALSRHANGWKSMGGAIEAALAAGRIDLTNAFGALEISNYLGHTLLHDTDMMSMAHSLEVREPLVDHELVELAMRIPGRLKLAGTGNKPLFTAAVPEAKEAAMRKKRGFELPFDAWLRGPLQSWARESLLGQGRAALPFLREDSMAALWRSFARGSQGVSWSRVFCLAVLADWCGRHRVTLA